MAIRVLLDRALLARRMSLTELADRVGVTIANLSILKTGKARAIRFSTLDALCYALSLDPQMWTARRMRRPKRWRRALAFALTARRSGPPGRPGHRRAGL
jgi:putative transcriptional regulator